MADTPPPHPGQEPPSVDRARQHVEQARARLMDDIDAVRARIRPAALMAETRERVTNRAQAAALRARDTVRDTVSAQPLTTKVGVPVVVAGLALILVPRLLARANAGTSGPHLADAVHGGEASLDEAPASEAAFAAHRAAPTAFDDEALDAMADHLREDARALERQGQSWLNEGRRLISAWFEQAQGTVTDGYQRVRPGLDTLADEAQTLGEQAKARAGTLASQAQQTFKTQPLAGLAAGLGLGALIAMLLPARHGRKARRQALTDKATGSESPPKSRRAGASPSTSASLVRTLKPLVTAWLTRRATQWLTEQLQAFVSKELTPNAFRNRQGRTHTETGSSSAQVSAEAADTPPPHRHPPRSATRHRGRDEW